MTILFWTAAGYLAGSIPTGYLAVKILTGNDIRSFGSGNIGATNVGRYLGKKWAVAIALFDMLKGGLAVLAASCASCGPSVMAITGIAAVVGHNYPIWLGFRGGKGVATTFGVIAFYNFFCPWPALLGGAVWYAVMKWTRYVSIASIAGLFSAAALTAAFGMPLQYTAASFFLAALSAWRHRSNIQRILNGTEIKVGTPK